MRIAAGAVALLTISAAASAQTYVAPHVDKNGNYREGYVRSNPDQFRFNNLNAENNQYGGVNPYTGKPGHQKDEYSSPPQYNQTYGQPPNQPRQRRGY